MKRPTPPRHLTAGFHQAGLAWYSAGGVGGPMRLHEDGPACWLWQFDPLERPCSGDLEVFHFIGRQRVRHALGAVWPDPLGFYEPLLAEEMRECLELAEWDPRNAGPGCTGHHRRLDSHATPELKIPAEALPLHVLQFIADWGLESDAARRFGNVEPIIVERLGPRELVT